MVLCIFNSLSKASFYYQLDKIWIFIKSYIGHIFTYKIIFLSSNLYRYIIYLKFLDRDSAPESLIKTLCPRTPDELFGWLNLRLTPDSNIWFSLIICTGPCSVNICIIASQRTTIPCRTCLFLSID